MTQNLPLLLRQVAVESLSCPVVLILGGRAKIDDFSELNLLFKVVKLKQRLFTENLGI